MSRGAERPKTEDGRLKTEMEFTAKNARNTKTGMQTDSHVRIGDIADVYDGPHATPKKTECGPFV